MGPQGSCTISWIKAGKENGTLCHSLLIHRAARQRSQKIKIFPRVEEWACADLLDRRFRRRHRRNARWMAIAARSSVLRCARSAAYLALLRSASPGAALLSWACEAAGVSSLTSAASATRGTCTVTEDYIPSGSSSADSAPGAPPPPGLCFFTEIKESLKDVRPQKNHPLTIKIDQTCTDSYINKSLCHALGPTAVLALYLVASPASASTPTG